MPSTAYAFHRRSRPAALPSIGYRGFAVAPITLRASSRSLLYNPGSRVATHVFQVSAEGELDTALIEWSGFDDNVYNAFVPYYPLLTTDTADCYKVSPGTVTQSDEAPAEGAYYQTDKGYVVYPENWTDSYYGALDALANLLTYGDASDADKAAVKAAYAELQQEIFADFDAMKAAVAAADTTQAKQAAATEASKAMAEKVHAKTLALYEGLMGKK